MKGIRRRLRPSPAMVVACTALIFAMTGAGYAAVVLPRNSVGMPQLKRNAVVSSKVSNGSLLARDFKAGQLPKGAKGDQGVQGPAGPGAQWATISPAGTILRQSGGITAAKVQTGGYRVTFPEVVTYHLILATPSLASDTSTRGTAIAGPCTDFAAACGAGANIPNSVAVFTLSTTGTQQDHGFTVAEMGPNSTTAPPVSGAARSDRRLASGN